MIMVHETAISELSFTSVSKRVLNNLFTRLIVKKLILKMFRPNVFGCLPSSGLNLTLVAIIRVFNPDDGKQPKTFGLNIFIFKFLTFSLVNRLFLLKRTLWTKRVLVHNFSFENEFDSQDNKGARKLISIGKVVHQDSF